MNPFPFQHECLNELDWFDSRAGLFADPGLGKTAMALWHLLRHRPGSMPAVVVCPASVKYFWERTAREMGLRSYVVEGRRDRGWSKQVTILNWDVLKDHAARLRKRGVKSVIADESQMATNSRAKRTLALGRLCKGVPRVLALSGTPFVNRPLELWPVLKLLRPDVFDSRLDFLRRFCSPKWTPWGWDYRGASNLDELNRLLASTCMVRRRKADVLPDLPPKLRDVIPLPLSDRAEYARAEDDFLGWLRDENPRAALSAARAEAFTQVGYLLRLAARLKLPAVTGWVEDWLAEGEGKLIVFARHRAVLDALEESTGKTHRLVRIDGGVTGMKRQRAVDEFQGNNRVRLLLGNIKAAGVGITLTAASTVAFAELGWTPGEHLQAEDRAYRIGTTDTVWAHYLVARGTVEVKLCGLLQRKQRDLSAVLDGGPTDEDLNVFDLLMGTFK